VIADLVARNADGTAANSLLILAVAVMAVYAGWQLGAHHERREADDARRRAAAARRARQMEER
jgi:hypothetical protein